MAEALYRKMVLSAVPADAADKRLALCAALASLAIFLAVAPVAGRPLPPVPVLVLVFQSALIVNDLVTAVLLLGQLRVAQTRALLVLTCAYLFTALMCIAYLLAFPGMFRQSGLIGDRMQSPAYLFVFWHAGFAAFLIAYALLKGGPAIRGNLRKAAVLAGCGVVALATALAALAVAGGDLLPPFFAGDRYSSPVGRYGQWVLTAVAILVLWARRPHSVLDLWILMTLLVMLFEIGLVAILNSGRFDLGFYAGRIYGVTGSLFVLVVLLVEQGGLHAGLLDAHERARAQIAARETEARYRTMADTMPQLAWITAADGSDPWYNQRFYEYTGLAPGQLKGAALEEHIHDPELLPLILERWTRSLATGEPFEMVMPLRGADGRFRHFLTRAQPLKDENGKVMQWFGTNTDVTAQREAEEALRKADRRKDEFLATLAHELRNPLAPIRNSTAVMRMLGPLPEELEKSREVIDRQTQHLSRLVDDLMEVSRVTQRKILLNRERVDLAALLREAAEAAGPAMEAAGLELIVRLPEEPLYAVADPTRLSQIFTNLLNNAAKFTPHGGRVWVGAGRQNGDAVISVRDSGVGIAPEHLETVFEMFSQPVPALRRAEAGLGIGLALVRGLVELHGGTVRASSPGRDQGSEFVVRLPLGAAQAPASPGPAEAPAAHGGKRILVVDDNGDVTGSVRRLLELAGHDVREARDGFEGVLAATEFDPQIVLLDIGMPRMNGYDAAREIRKRAPGTPPLILAMTGWGQEADKERAREAGFDGHLVKPVDPALLLQVVGA